jgi:cell division protein ZapA
MSPSTLTINVANKSLKIACPVGEESALLAAAQELNLRFTKANDKTCANSSLEQSMLMTALNLSYDLLKAQEAAEKEKLVLESKIELLQSTIEQAFAPTEKDPA